MKKNKKTNNSKSSENYCQMMRMTKMNQNSNAKRYNSKGNEYSKWPDGEKQR